MLILLVAAYSGIEIMLVYLFVCFLSGHLPSDGKWGFIKGFYLTSKGAVRTTV